MREDEKRKEEEYKKKKAKIKDLNTAVNFSFLQTPCIFFMNLCVSQYILLLTKEEVGQREG